MDKMIDEEHLDKTFKKTDFSHFFKKHILKRLTKMKGQ